MSPEGRFERRRDMPGLWLRCPDCQKMVTKNRVREMLNVCPECNYHFEISSEERIRTLLDPGSFRELFAELEPRDPLGFVGRRSYRERLKQAQETTGLKDACVVGTGRIGDVPLVFGVGDSELLIEPSGPVEGTVKPPGSKSYTNRALLVAALARENAVDELRRVIGATDPAEAEEGTVRKLYATDKTRNAIHASDSEASAKRELNFFFDPRELVDYRA